MRRFAFSTPSGTELAESRDVFGLDPFLDVTLPADGRYVIKVHDAIYAGSTDHVYRLTVHDGPHLDAILPAAARARVAHDIHRDRQRAGSRRLGRPATQGRRVRARAVELPIALRDAVAAGARCVGAGPELCPAGGGRVSTGR